MPYQVQLKGDPDHAWEPVRRVLIRQLLEASQHVVLGSVKDCVVVLETPTAYYRYVPDDQVGQTEDF